MQFKFVCLCILLIKTSEFQYIQQKRFLNKLLSQTMSFFRSDPIDHYKMIMPRQNAWNVLNLMGQLNMAHIVKSSKSHQTNPYYPQTKRCQESLSKIYQLQSVLQHNKLYDPTLQYKYPQMINIFKLITQKHKQLQKKKSTSILIEIQQEVEEYHHTYKSLNSRKIALEQKLENLRENIAIIKSQQKIFGVKRGSKLRKQNPNADKFFQIFENQDLLQIKCGVVNKQEEQVFSKAVFRMSRGISYLKFIQFSQIFQKITEKQKNKSVYFLIFPGKKNNYFEKKIAKLLTNYHQSTQQVYFLPNEHYKNLQALKRLIASYNETELLLKMVSKELDIFYRQKLLGYDQNLVQQHTKFKGYNQKYTKISTMKIYLIKQLQIFNQLKEMDIYNNFLQAQVYIKSAYIDQFKQRLSQLQRKTRTPAVRLIPITQTMTARSHKKPTAYHINSYTRSAQQIVQTYGVAKYRQANPAFFTTVTFPFLFGVMFGDIGHGFLLFMLGLLLVFKKQEIKNMGSMFASVVRHRYLFALMGFFSTYCGFIYNDFLSINLNLFGSCYAPESVEGGQPIPRAQNCIYPFGLDPVWSRAQNSLNYTNSLKMKISVIIGVVHMILGICVKAANSLYFRRKVQLVFQTIPQLIFMILVFGYMDFLIIFKWLKDWGYGNPHAPSIITTMINLPLMVGKTDKECCHGGEPMWGVPSNTSQDRFQIQILLVALLCIPLMLLVKPIYMICKMKRHQEKHNHHQRLQSDPEQHDQSDFYQIFDDEPESQDEPPENTNQIDYIKNQKDFDRHEQAHEPSEIFVHQMIETIQFVLGCISNTASYLRLWALSLAHSQLAEVFLQKTLVDPLQKGYKGILGMIILFPMFAGATFGVLMCMDVMQCFLHTLRLHWVQFQNKFYKGDGYAFEPFNFLSKVNEHHALNYKSTQKGSQ